MAYVLGIDIGTTGAKTILADEEGRILASAYQGYGLLCEKEFVEQNADDWWEAAVRTVRECLAKVQAGKVSALSLSSQGATLVPVDEGGQPLRRAIVWMDTRAHEQADALRKSKPEHFFHRKTGWRLSSSFNVVQIKWLRDNEPALFRKTRRFLSTIDYVNWKLTGRYSVDPTNAGITQLFDIVEKKWAAEILDAVGLEEGKLSEVVDSGRIIGNLSANAAGELGLDPDVNVISGGHDQYCAALACGAVTEGDVLLSTGTSWVALGILDRPLFTPDAQFAVGRHLIDDRWGALAYTPTGGAALEWCRGRFLNDQDYAEINRQVEAKAPGADGVMFFPNFAGTACPTWSSVSGGSILGLKMSHDRYHLARAVMEGVVFNINWILETLKSHGVVLGPLKMQGGATKSSVWPGIVSDVCGLPVKIATEPDMSCVGAAILAGYGAGHFPSILEGIRRLAPPERTIEPNVERTALYQELFQKYKKACDALCVVYENREGDDYEYLGGRSEPR